jgi:hypothetical protein
MRRLEDGVKFLQQVLDWNDLGFHLLPASKLAEYDGSSRMATDNTELKSQAQACGCASPTSTARLKGNFNPHPWFIVSEIFGACRCKPATLPRSRLGLEALFEFCAGLMNGRIPSPAERWSRLPTPLPLSARPHSTCSDY